MTQFIAQATQPAGGFATWTPTEWGLFFTAAGVFLGGVGATVVSIIIALRAKGAADVANTKADANSTRLNQHGEHIYDLAIAQESDPSATVALRAKAQSPTEGTTTP